MNMGKVIVNWMARDVTREKSTDGVSTAEMMCESDMIQELARNEYLLE